MVERRRRFDLPDVTMSLAGNELRREIQTNDRDDLTDLESRVSATGTGDQGVSLTAAERSEVNDALTKRQERMEDIASRKEANIFGSTAEQAEMARDAKRGMTTDPGQPVMSAGLFDIPTDDFQEAQDFHEQRSESAQARDNKQNAPLTTDVDTWKEDPGGWDFPGVDTFGEPDVSDRQRKKARKANRDRSLDARMRDKSTLAPMTTDAEKYASAPDEFDFPGLDTPTEFDNDFL